MTKIHSPRVLAAQVKSRGSFCTAEEKANKATDRKAKNKAAVEAYRQRLKEDPVRYQQLKDQNKERAKKNRRRPKTEEEKVHHQILHNQCQRRYV